MTIASNPVVPIFIKKLVFITFRLESLSLFTFDKIGRTTVAIIPGTNAI